MPVKDCVEKTEDGRTKTPDIEMMLAKTLNQIESIKCNRCAEKRKETDEDDKTVEATTKHEVSQKFLRLPKYLVLLVPRMDYDTPLKPGLPPEHVPTKEDYLPMRMIRTHHPVRGTEFISLEGFTVQSKPASKRSGF